jgi:hypothetical protein
MRLAIARHLTSPALCAFLALVAMQPLVPGCAEAGLVICELLPGPATDWNGSGGFSSRDDEWVEVFNTGPDPVDLSSFLLTDGDSIPRYAFTGMLDPGGRVLVFGSASYDWERANGHPAFGLSLANGGDAVILWRVTGPDTVVVDAYTYRSHEAASDRAVGRTFDSGPWVLLDGLNPYTGTIAPFGTGCPPTPNSANACGTTPTRRESWGRLKAIYR